MPTLIAFLGICCLIYGIAQRIRKKISTKKMFLFIVAWLVLSGISGTISTIATDPNNKTANISTANTSEDTNTKINTKATWHDVITFEGDSTKNTQTFHISSNNWAISWATTPGKYGDMNFAIMIYDENGNLIDSAANIIGKGSDTTYMKGSGNYYLKIITGQPYKIRIEEYK
jgi:hypothetical protein